ncbi:MAG: hypothetical protein KC636_29870 [Myxococcales bacterium]|nr:hypothetical protein [Myxococcales bacterium]
MKRVSHVLRSPGTTMALSAAALFIGACAGAGSSAIPPDAIVKCQGVNGCKGQGQCMTKAADGALLNQCGGQNSCKGKGWVETAKSSCDAQGGQLLPGSYKQVAVCTPAPEDASAHASVVDEHYNLNDGLAIQGYDPVAYFPEGGGKPTKGSPEFAHTHEGVTYHFASAEHLERFKQDPAKYEPAFGGWCAYAMGKTGRKVKINPESAKIQDGRLLLFYATSLADTREKWNEDDSDRLLLQADSEWYGKTGQCLRAETK